VPAEGAGLIGEQEPIVGQAVGSLAVLAFHHDLPLAFQVSPGGDLLHGDQALGQDAAVAHPIQAVVVSGRFAWRWGDGRLVAEESQASSLIIGVGAGDGVGQAQPGQPVDGIVAVAKLAIIFAYQFRAVVMAVGDLSAQDLLAQ
jgi:hypothetical protein